MMGRFRVSHARRWALAGLCCAMAIGALPQSAEAQAKTSRIEVARGETVELKIMYNIDGRTCVWQKVPPQPRFRTAPKLGQVTVREGKTRPHQCPDRSIDAHIAHYTAGRTPGTDRFEIDWQSTEGRGKVFRRSYVVHVK